MIQIETLEIAGLRAATRALRLPYNKEARSYSTFEFDTEGYWEKGGPRGNTAVMYRTQIDLNPNDLHLMEVLKKRGDSHAKPLRGIIAWAEINAPIYFWWDLETHRIGHERLFSESTMHGECKGLKGEELQKVKGEIPFGRMIKKVDCFSYQCLRNIYLQRRTHRLPEFHDFCKWIETLPYAKELILPDDINDDNNGKESD